MAERPVLITAALPYANGPLHLGHLAGAYLPADIYARFTRAKKRNTLFICGSDEHGVAITIAAEKAGVQPQDIVDKYHHMIRESFEAFGMSFDHYGRTSSAVHKETSQAFFIELHKQGLFKQKEDEQLFDEKAGMFLPDRYVVGTCPVCDFPEAYGDQCERCGSSLSPTELKNPKSALTGNTPILKKTRHWYIPLGEFESWLQTWIGEKHDWKSNVVGQCKSWLSNGLSDRAVTRDLSWGVPVPLQGAEDKVLYVWFDAPIGYISATKEWALERGDKDQWKEYWQNDETELYHFIGKDNIVFHCLMFPSMLKAHGKFVLPKNVPANEFLNLEGRKLSTSRGWAVWLHEYLEDLPADYLRFVLCSIMPENKDSDFSWKDFQTRVNSELADIVGNFLFRTQSFIGRYFENTLPKPTLGEEEKKALEAIKRQKIAIERALERFQFREAIAQWVHLARLGNRYFTEHEPWKTRKDNPEKCATTLFVCAQIAGALAVLGEPFLPFSMEKLKIQLGISGSIDWDHVGKDCFEVGHCFGQSEILFSKIEDETIETQLAKLQAHAPQPTQPKSDQESASVEYGSIKANIEFEDFLKLDLRTGTITSAQPVKKSTKLLQLEIDLGMEKRTILSGVAKQFSPNEIMGKKVVVVANLAPKKMAGIESEGMILMAETAEGTLSFLSHETINGMTIS